jgi:hypothetical protein
MPKLVYSSETRGCGAKSADLHCANWRLGSQHIGQGSINRVIGSLWGATLFNETNLYKCMRCAAPIQPAPLLALGGLRLGPKEARTFFLNSEIDSNEANALAGSSAMRPALAALQSISPPTRPRARRGMNDNPSDFSWFA